MTNSVLAAAAAALVVAWGIAHVVPTRAVIAGFGNISRDNRRILAMEWIAEALTMVFVGLVVATVALVFGAASAPAAFVDRAGACILAAVAVLTATTGARTPVIWFKACPVVMSVAVGLLLAASFV